MHLNGAAQAEWVEFLPWRVRVRIIQTAQTAQRKCVAGWPAWPDGRPDGRDGRLT